MNSDLLTKQGAIRQISEHSAQALIAGILAIALVASVLILWQAGTAQPAATEITTGLTSGEASPGTNPELLAARRYAAEQGRLATGVTRNDAAFLAANPELLKAAPQTAHAADADGRAFLAANPELSVARRYAAEQGRLATGVTRSDAAFLAANPELSVARRYAGQSGNE